MNKNIFIKSLPLVAMAVGNRMGIQVVIRGNQAKTDGRTIYLPILPDGDESLGILARGYIDHEAGHIRHTDFSVTGATPIHRKLTNLFEDIRIEQAMGRSYPGCAVNLRRLAAQLAQEGLFTPDEAPEQIFLAWVLASCRSRVLKQEALAPIAKEAHGKLAKFLGPPLVGKVERFLVKADTLESTRQAAALAEEIVRLLRQEQKADESQGKSSPEPGADCQTGDRSEKTLSAPSKEDRKDEALRTSENLDEACRPGPGPGGDQSTTSPCPKAGRGHADNRKALAEILQKDSGEFGDIGANCAEKLNATSQNSEGKDQTGVYPGESPAQGDSLGPPPDLHQVRAETVALRHRLTGMVQASRLKRSNPGGMGHWIDHRVLHRLTAGDPHVFRRKDEKVAVNTAALILLDRSGSMGGSSGRIALARKVVMALADALGTIPGVHVAAAAFPGLDSQVVPLTRFGESVAGTRANYGIQASGGTPLHMALGWVRAQMMVRPEARKIVLVATDGQPCDPLATRALVEKIEGEGVEMMGLGILDHGISKKYFRKNRTIDGLHELPEAIFAMFQDALTKR